METNITVVIPAYNEEKTIAKTLDALCNQSLAPDNIVVVDNNSTDRTSEIVSRFQQKNSIVHLIREARKGTGYACNAGFRYAIDVCGATIISRIDADTLPSAQWNLSVADYFAKHPKKLFVTGPNMPRRDEEFYRFYDWIIWPLFWKVCLTMWAIIRRQPFFLRFGFGHNLSIRKEAYEATEGFTLTAIDERDEDLALNQAVYDSYGFSAMGFAQGMSVHTSVRRVRRVGYFGFITYYAFPSKARRLKKTAGNVDVR